MKRFFLLILIFFCFVQRIAWANDPLEVDVGPVAEDELPQALLALDPQHPNRGTLTLYKRMPSGHAPEVSRVLTVADDAIREIGRIKNDYTLQFQQVAGGIGENDLTNIYLNLDEPDGQGHVGLLSATVGLKRKQYHDGKIVGTWDDYDVANDGPAVSALSALNQAPLEQVVHIHSSNQKYKVRGRLLHWDGTTAYVIPEMNLIRWMAGLDNQLTILPVEPTLLNVDEIDSGLRILKRKVDAKKQRPSDPFVEGFFTPEDLLTEADKAEVTLLAGDDAGKRRYFARKQTMARAKKALASIARDHERVFSSLSRRNQFRFSSPNRPAVHTWVGQVLLQVGAKPPLTLDEIVESHPNCERILRQAENAENN